VTHQTLLIEKSSLLSVFYLNALADMATQSCTAQFKFSLSQVPVFSAFFLSNL